jgi:hypothetical protein
MQKTTGRVEKFLQKIRPKTDFFLSIFFITFLGVSRREKFKNAIKNKSGPGPFLASDPPTYHGGHRFFFGGPLERAGPGP